MRSEPKAVMVPFGYWGYPKEMIDQRQKESEDMVRSLGIDVTTVSRVDSWADAKKSAAELRRLDCDFIIVLLPAWLEALNFTETLQDHFHKPFLLWSHTMFRQGKERLNMGPMAGVGVLRETFEELGLKFRFVWGMPQEERVQKAIKFYADILATVNRLRHSKIGLLGYGSMGMYTAFFDHLGLKRDLGPEVEQVDQYVMVKKIEEMDSNQVQDILAEVKAKWEIAPAVKDSDLETTVKMYHVLKDLIAEYDWSALTVKCQYELSKHYKHVPCVPLSMLGGELPVSCEGDIPLITTQLVMHYLSNGGTTTYCDLHDIGEKDLTFAACGYAPFCLGEGKPKVDKTETIYEGVANCTIYKEGRVTFARLAYTRQRGYKMHIAGGEAHHAEPFREVGCLPYPSMAVSLDGSTEHFGQHIMSQHYSIMYGDYRKQLSEFCDLMGIQEIRS